MRESKRPASTDLEAKSAQPEDKPYRLSFGDGLQLEVKPTGFKVWVMRYRSPTTGRPSIFTIGKYPAVTLRQAKMKALEAKERIEEGVDPNRQKKREKMEMRGETFKDVALEWHANQLERWTENNAAQVMACLENDIFKYIGNASFSDLEAPDILQVIRRKEGVGALDKARKVKQRIGAVFRYAVATGRARYNPVPDLGPALKAKGKNKHFNALTLEELPAFLQELASYRSEVLRRAVQFTLLTFARTGTIRAAEWQEIDWQAARWNVPGEHMKMGDPHIIPLSRQALKLLEELLPFTGDSRYIFYTNRRTQPISSNALLSVLRNMGWNDRTTIHGFRALASSTLHDAGFDPHVIEKQLAHAERNKVAAAYSYMAEYLPVRTEMMQFWGDFIDSQATGGKVVPIRAGQAAKAL
ncbi:MAG: tyrosine-type recombinase/integrase [Thiolinea sp.]